MVSIHTNQRRPGPTPEFRVRGRWSLNLYAVAGEIRFPGLGGRYPIRRGTACLMPPGTRRRFVFSGHGAHRVAHFRLPLEMPPDSPAPWIGESGRRYRPLVRLCEEMIAADAPARRACLLWQALWLLRDIAADETDSASPDTHPAVRRATAHIRERLDTPLSVGEVVGRAGISHNHLIRLFRATYGTTIAGYIRARRMERVREMLVRTDMPIKTVAAEAGIPDLQRFNKTVRRHFGRPPSRLRAEAREEPPDAI